MTTPGKSQTNQVEGMKRNCYAAVLQGMGTQSQAILLGWGKKE